MKRLNQLLVAATLALVAADAQAGTEAGYAISRDFGRVLSAVAGNASSGARTFTLSGLGQHYRTAKVQIDHTYHAATAITLVCTKSVESTGTKFGSITTLDPNTGTVAVLATPTLATGSVSTDTVWDVSVAGAYSIKCVAGFTGGDGTDAADVYASVVVGQ